MKEYRFLVTHVPTGKRKKEVVKATSLSTAFEAVKRLFKNYKDDKNMYTAEWIKDE